MRIRSAAQFLRCMAILAAALGGCQTADRTSSTSRLGLGTSLSSSPTVAVDPDNSKLASGDAKPSVVQVSGAAEQAVLPSEGKGTTDPRLPDDLTVATTVPALPSSAEPKASAKENRDRAGQDAQRPVVANLPPAPAGPGSPADPSAAQLTLDAAIAISLDRNPTLVSLRASEPVAQAALDVARHYPFNPYVQVEATPIVKDLGGGNGAVLNYVLLMQTLEFAHQQDFREASAAAACNQVRWNIVAAELTNMATTERLYLTALYQRDLRDLAARTAALYEEVDADVERRLSSGPFQARRRDHRARLPPPESQTSGAYRTELQSGAAGIGAAAQRRARSELPTVGAARRIRVAAD